MQTTSLFRRAAALALTLVLAVSASLAGFATYDMPIQTVSDTESVYLFNLDTGKPILDQNAGQSRYIASLTKMMTALLFLESGKDLNEEITIPTSLTQEFKDIQNANGSTMNLRIGETVRRIDLLYGLLVASANDAASVIASDVSGGNLPAFVSMMNQKAQELGCTGTSFTCVHGLYDYGNVSTAEDLAKIASACYANETYMQVANTQSYTLPATNLHQNERTITSTNLMLNPEYPYYRDYIRGMKTGFTSKAGGCLIATAHDGDVNLLSIVCGCDKVQNDDGTETDERFTESKGLLEFGFSHFSYVQQIQNKSTRGRRFGQRAVRRRATDRAHRPRQGQYQRSAAQRLPAFRDRNAGQVSHGRSAGGAAGCRPDRRHGNGGLPRKPHRLERSGHADCCQAFRSAVRRG